MINFNEKLNLYSFLKKKRKERDFSLRKVSFYYTFSIYFKENSTLTFIFYSYLTFEEHSFLNILYNVISIHIFSWCYDALGGFYFTRNSTRGIANLMLSTVLEPSSAFSPTFLSL